jgi:hypothetical protein
MKNYRSLMEEMKAQLGQQLTQREKLIELRAEVTRTSACVRRSMKRYRTYD